jgi:hypothetical protein
MDSSVNRTFYLNPTDWTWWTWLVTAVCLAVGLAGWPAAFLVAIALTAIQVVVFLAKERRLAAFSVQLRIAYLALLALCYIPEMRWLYWLPAVGTFALVIFGYCLLARTLSLCPWNVAEPYSVDRIRRTFFSTPDPSRVHSNPNLSSCAGGLCSIEAQVAPPKEVAEHGDGPDEQIVRK